jgi:hypothetical protein
VSLGRPAADAPFGSPTCTQAVWLLLTEPIVNQGDDHAWAEAFSTRERALASLAHLALSWRRSELNPDFQEAEAEDPSGRWYRYTIYRPRIDETATYERQPGGSQTTP